MTLRTRRYLMSFVSIMFMFIAGQNAQVVSEGDAGGITWFVMISALVAGFAGIAAVNQYANQEVTSGSAK